MATSEHKQARLNCLVAWWLQQQINEANKELRVAQKSPYTEHTLSVDFMSEDVGVDDPPTTLSHTHEEQAQHVGYRIPHFFDPDRTRDFKLVYVIADFLLPLSVVVPLGVKHCLYQVLLPPRIHIELKFLTYPPGVRDLWVNSW